MHTTVLAVEILPNRTPSPKHKFRAQIRCDSPKFSEETKSFSLVSPIRGDSFRIPVSSKSCISISVVTAKSLLSKEQKVGSVSFPANFVHSCVHDVNYDLIDESTKEVSGRIKMKILVGALSGSRTPESSPRAASPLPKRQRSKSDNAASRTHITSTGSSSPSSAFSTSSPHSRQGSDNSLSIPALTITPTGIPTWDSIFEALKSDQPNFAKAAQELCQAVRENPVGVPPSVFVALQHILPKCFSSTSEDDESVEDSDSFTGLSQLAISASAASLEIISCITMLGESDMKTYKFQPGFVDWLCGSSNSAWRLSALKDVVRIALSDAQEPTTEATRTRLATKLLKLLQSHSICALDIIHGAFLACSERRFFFDLGYAPLLVKLSTAKDQKRTFRQQVIKRLRELVVLGCLRLKVQNADLLEMIIDIYGPPSSPSAQSPREPVRKDLIRSSRGSTSSSAEIPVLSVDIDLECDDVVASDSGSDESEEN
eukprot:TRINITY_DN170_c0_g1_i1.p1 TRINITY_DN170_c0_g1~~TRINITY_DN170_c0_g1_i1.p1  ORF type:complete len:486 (+),score=70.50 TRINITY_DN170_c0_g1_i1:332-1789(+)